MKDCRATIANSGDNDDGDNVLTPDETRRWTQVGMLAALAIILGYLETFVPIPIPGVKLGLANIAILIALAQHDLSGAFGIAVIKVLASGLLFGSPIMMAYSVVGTLLAFAIMAPLSQIRSMHLAMTSVVGAMAHEVGQLVVATLLLGTPLVWYSAPVLLVAGCVTGGLCGMVAARTVELLKDGERIAACVQIPDKPTDEADAPNTLPQRGPATGDRSASARVLLIGFLVFCVLTLRATSVPALGLALACSIIACVAGRVRMQDVALALRPLAFMLVITFVAQVASNQAGVVLATLGPVRITQEALVATGTMMVRLLSLTAASLSVMYLTSIDELVGAIDWLLSPLRLLGLRTAGFMLALKTALEFVPLFAATIQQSSAQLRGKKDAKGLLRDTFPRMIAQLYGSR